MTTPQDSGRCGGRATPTGPTRGAENEGCGEPCDVIEGDFVWGVQRCMAEGVGWYVDGFGDRWAVCAAHRNMPVR